MTAHAAQLALEQLEPACAASSLAQLQQFLLPRSEDTESLYLRQRVGRFRLSDNRLELEPFTQISFDTFFNSFYETYWVEYTTVRRLLLSFEGTGRLWCSIFRQDFRGKRRRIACKLVDLIRQGESSIELELDNHRKEVPGRLYVEIYAADAPVKLDNICWKTISDVSQNIAIGVVLCTYNREALLERTLAALTQTAREASLERIIVVNQGEPFVTSGIRALLQREADLIKVIQQPNYGGTGGFTRGAMELLDTGSCTHALFLDDDIDLEPHSVTTAACFLRFAAFPFVLGGQMLNLFDRTWMFDSGGRIEHNTMYANHRNVDLAQVDSLAELADISSSHFNGWWFTIFPLECFRKHGLPVPMFVHVDDVEYGVRLTEAGVPVVVVPPIAIWHEPYIAKSPCWFGYYDVRNWSIFGSLYPSRLYLDSPRALLRRALGLLLRYDYHQVLCLKLGIDDFLRGPELMDKDLSEIQTRITGLLRPLLPESLSVAPDLPFGSDKIPRKPMTVRFHILMSLLRILAGYPKDNYGGPECIMASDMPFDFMNLGRSYVLTRDGRYFLRFSYSRTMTWLLIREILMMAMRYSVRGRKASALWKNAYSELTSYEKWSARLRTAAEERDPASA